MAERDKEAISPTVKKILDEYRVALHADGEINNEAVDRLDALLRKGKVPKSEEIDAALFPPKTGDKL